MRALRHPTMKDITLDGILHALGDPIRLHMVRKLSGGCKGQTMNCTEAAEELCKLAPSTRTHHLRILREAGLVKSERKGVEVHNALRADELEKRFPGLLHSILSQK